MHFLRFPALTGQKDRPPVFLLAGGPGSELGFKTLSEVRRLDRLRRTRDVVYLSHRGNSRAPGLVPALNLTVPPRPLDREELPARTRELQRAAFAESLRSWTARGVDLRGYDILNIVDDLHDLRTALGYDKTVLRGCSFGSQWGFAYLKRWPATVDRALLSGVEPCDESTVMAQELPEEMERINSFIDADFRTTPPEAFFATLPKSVTYPAVKFEPAGRSLYEGWLAGN